MNAHPLIMGVLNVTPDSFSDGGRYLDTEAALEQARRLIAQGADIVDVGGESTRPGATRVHPNTEQSRVIPVIETLAAEGITVSVDTVNASTARLAVAAGARIINDVSGGTADPELLTVAAETGARLVLMHWRGIPELDHSRSHYGDVVAEVRADLMQLVAAAQAARVAHEQIVLDPGLGFDKTAAQGWELLARLDELGELGFPLLIGVSRKRMVAETLAARRGVAAADIDNTERDLATAVVSALATRAGVWGVRVHAVAASRDALAIAAAMQPQHSLQKPSQKMQPPRGEMQLPIQAIQVSSTPSSLPQSDCLCATQGDRITLTGLEVHANHGVFEFERAQGQRFVIDAELTLDLGKASESDDLAHTVNYAEVAEAILADASGEAVDLIETLAERLARLLLGFTGVREARVTVHKPEAPIAAKFADVSVTVMRRAEKLR